VGIALKGVGKVVSVGEVEWICAEVVRYQFDEASFIRVLGLDA